MNARLLLFILVVLAGGVLGHFMLQGSGYILISFQKWVIETSLWVFVISVIVSVVLIYVLLQIFMGIIKTPNALRNWQERRGNYHAVGKTVKGLIALAEGNWSQSEKLLLSGAKGNGRIINYLAAARAAQSAGNYEHSDELMALAAKSTKGAELAVGLQHAQLQLEREQYEQCLATCLRLQKQFPKHQYVNKLLLKTHTALHDWQAVLDLLPKLNKHKLLANKQSQELEIKAYQKLIKNMIASRNTLSKDPKAVIRLWRKIPARTLKQLDFAPLAHAYISHLIHLGAQQEAERELRDILDHHWTPELVRLYGWVKGSDSKRQLLFCKDQLKHRTNDAMLLLTMGRISLMNQEFTEAKEYFETSLNLENSVETRNELSRLYLANQEPDKALEMLRQGLGMALPELPMPIVKK